MVAEPSVEVVLVGTDATFRITPALPVMLLYVYDQAGTLIWHVTRHDVIRDRGGEGRFMAIPIADASPELRIAAAQSESVGRPAEPRHPSSKQPLALVQYGVVPEGYQEEAPAAPLAPGRYDVLVIARDASQVGASFDVADA